MISMRKQISEMQEFCKEKKEIYIYGAGKYGKLCKRMLDYLKIPVKGIFVTDSGCNTEKYIDGAPIIQWDSDIFVNSEGVGVIVATTRYYEVMPHIKPLAAMVWFEPAPSMVEITTKIGCSVNCRYCPQKNLMNAYYKKNQNGMLNMTDYVQILKNIPPLTTIRFCGMCEPFLNPECADMIVYTKEEGFHVDCYSTLVGLDICDIDRVLDAIDELVVHIPDKDGNAAIDVTDEYIEKLKRVLDYRRNGERFVKAISVHGDVHEKIRELIPQDAAVSSYLQGRAGNLDNDNTEQYWVEAPLTCEFHRNRLDETVLLPSGDVIICCSDYSMQHVFGNLLNERYEDILNSEAAVRVREAMIYGKQKVLCNTCEFAERLL